MTGTTNLKEKTAKGFLWAAMGNGAQQLVMMLIGVVMARLLSVADYGVVAMLTVFSIVGGVLQESGFISAIGVKKRVDHSDYNAVFWFNILVGGTVYCILFFCAPLIASFNKSPQLTVLGRVMFLGFVFSSFGTAHAAYLFRNLMVRQKTSAQVAASLLSGLIGLGIAFGGGGCWSLVVMDLSYKLTYTVLVWHYSPWRPTLQIDLRPAFHMFGFSSRLLATSLLTTLNNQLLQALLGHYYPAREVGHYSQANKWNTMGCSLLTGMVGNVAQPVLAGVGEEAGRQLRIFRKMLRFTAMLSFPALGGFALIAPEFIPLLIGDKWLPCVPYLQTICIAGAIMPVSQMFSNLLISKGRSGDYLLSTACFLLLQLICVVTVYPYGIGTLLCFVVGLNLVWLLVWYALAHRLTSITLWQVATDLLPFLLATLVSLVLAALTAEVAAGRLIRLVLKVTVAVAAYAGIMQALRVTIWKECVVFLVSKFRK